MAQINNAAIRGEVNFEATAKITGNGNRSNTAYQNTDGTNTFGNTSYDTVVNGKNATVNAAATAKLAGVTANVQGSSTATVKAPTTTVEGTTSAKVKAPTTTVEATSTANVSAPTVNIGKSGANITLTGNKTAMNTKFVVNGNVYGTSLPSTGEAGQVFFKII